MEDKNIQTEKGQVTALYIQLYQYFVEQIENGQIIQGQRLPSVRSLSKRLALSKSTIENTYDKLVSDGYVISRPKAGYYCDVSLTKKAKSLLNEENKSENEQEIRYDFSSRSLEPGHFEGQLWRRYMRYVMDEEAYIASYGESQGEWFLRQQLNNYLHRQRGLNVTTIQLIIGAGIQPLLYLFCSIFKDRCLKVGFIKPGFPEAMRVFEDCHHQVIMLDNLEQLDGLNILYLTQEHLHMKMKERLALLSNLRERRIFLIEDDYNGDLCYENAPMNSVQGMYGEDVVFYLNSFSKLLLPSVRMACMSVPPKCLHSLQRALKAYNQTASKIEQFVFALYIQDGHLERSVKRLRKLYLKKSHLMAQILIKYFPQKTIHLVETQLCYEISGYFSSAFYERLHQAGIRISHSNTNILRLYFGGIPEELIESGITEIYAIKKTVE